MACSSTNKNISRQDKHSWSFMTLYGVWLYGMNLQKGWASLSKLSIVKPVDACWGGSRWGEAAKISPYSKFLVSAQNKNFARWKQNLGTETGACHPSIRLFAVIPVREQWLAMTCPHLGHTEQPQISSRFCFNDLQWACAQKCCQICMIWLPGFFCSFLQGCISDMTCHPSKLMRCLCPCILYTYVYDMYVCDYMYLNCIFIFLYYLLYTIYVYIFIILNMYTCAYLFSYTCICFSYISINVHM